MRKIRLLCILSFIIGCLFALVGCNKTQLATPGNFDVDATTLSLTWDPVEGARGYRVLVNGEPYNTVSPSYPLDPLPAGDYEISVQAIAMGQDMENSKWSKTYEYTRPLESGLQYTLINNNTEYAVSSIGTAVGDIVIEESYRGKPITQIADMAFSNRGKEVGTITIKGNNLRQIGTRAFYNCVKLSSINIPESVKEIGAYAFFSCKDLKSITLPEGLTSIKEQTFAYCRGMETITIPQSVTSIGKAAFKGCDILDNVVIPDTVKELGESSFSDCIGMTTLKIGNKIETIPMLAFARCDKLVNLTIGTGVKTISEEAFTKCVSLTSVEFPDSVETISDSAFLNCLMLNSVDFGANLSKIGSGAFANTMFWLSAESGIVYMDGWALGRNGLPFSEKSFAIPEGTIGVADYAFADMDTDWSNAGWSLITPSSLKYIGDYAFRNNTKLSALELGTGMIKVGIRAFSGCSDLYIVSIEEGLQVIDNYAFAGCKNYLTVLSLPSTLTRIGTRAFENTTYWKNSMGIVYVDSWVVGNTNDSAEVAHIYEGTVGISDYAFYDTMGLNTLTVPDSVTYIGRCAFYNCASLVSVDIPSGITAIEDFTFYNCVSLQNVILPGGVTKIGYSAFNKCMSLTFMDIPSAVQTIGDYAFFKCTALTSVSFATTTTDDGEVMGVTSIGEKAFYNCASLIQVELPDTLNSLGLRAFYNCSSLTSIKLSENLEVINDYTFYGCSALTEITIPESVQSIGNYAFRGCAALTSITFENVKEVGRYAFYGCTALTDIQFNKGITSIGDYAFRNCSALVGVVLPSTVTTIGKHVFNGAVNATFYTDNAERPMGWLGQFNTSYRPIFWGCTLSEDNSYVVSFVKSATSITNYNALNGMAAPVRAGYTFEGWTTEEGSKIPQFTMENVFEVPTGETVYAIWTEIVNE